MEYVTYLKARCRVTKQESNQPCLMNDRA